MEQKLKSFLAECEVNSRDDNGQKGEPYTHVSKFGGKWPAGSYWIDRKYLDKFWKIYEGCIQKKIYPTIGEKPAMVMPVHHDFDFTIKLKKGMKAPKRLYSKEQIFKLAKIYQEEAKKIIREDAYEDRLIWVFITEKPAARSDGDEVRDGLHLHMPFFLTISDVQDLYLRDVVIQRMKEEELWDENKYVKYPVPDEFMARKPWMLYGSMNYKNSKSQPYLYVRKTRYPEIDDPVKKEEGKKVIKQGYAIDHNLKEIPLVDFFEKEMIGRQGKTSVYLPEFLSTHGYDTPTPLIDSINIKYRPRIKKEVDSNAPKRPIELVYEDIKTIKDGQIMQMLSYERAEEYNSWLEVGFALYNIGQGIDEALELWIEFSRQAANFVEGYCEEMWNRMTYQGKSINWLLSMARKDSPEDYKKWKQEKIDWYMDYSLQKKNPTAYDISVVVKKMYGDKFLCAWAKKNEWYYFENHKWVYMDDGVTLKKLFPTELTNEYYRYKAKLAHDQMGADANQRNQIQAKIDRCDKVVEKLGDPRFWKLVVEACVVNMHDPNFNVKLNMSNKIFVCENCVLDLEALTYRDGRMDDYSTNSCGLNYPKEPPSPEKIAAVDEFWTKIFPNKNRREYFWDYIASLMEGVNRNKIILICTGPSDGGKSVSFSFLGKLFGTGETGYWGTFPPSLVETGNRVTSAQARPELFRAIGKKAMSIAEISKYKTLDVGGLKQLCGDTDVQWYRTGHDFRGRECRQTYSLLFQLNDPPKIPSSDQATWNRIRILDFESKFVRPTDLEKFPVPESFEEQMRMKRFKADIYLSEKMDELAETMLWMLFERYKKYKVHGIREPREVFLATQNYQSENDIFQQFIDDKLEKVDDEDEAREKFITKIAMYAEFKDWIKANYESHEKVSQNEMIKEINRKIGVIKEVEDIHGFDEKKKRWYGWSFKKEEGMDDGFDSRKLPPSKKKVSRAESDS